MCIVDEAGTALVVVAAAGVVVLVVLVVIDVLLWCRHYPKTTATVVAETPELARLAHNTKIQSQVIAVSS